MTCMENCEVCKANPGYVCHGDFYTTGDYANLIKEFDIHGVSFIQKVDSVKDKLDNDTIQILKVLLQDNEHPFSTWHALEVIYALDIIQSRLSNDNNSYVPGDGTDD